MSLSMTMMIFSLTKTMPRAKAITMTYGLTNHEFTINLIRMNNYFTLNYFGSRKMNPLFESYTMSTTTPLFITNTIPYDYQSNALNWIVRHNGGILAAEMGTGKTFMTLMAFQHDPCKTIFVAPKSVVSTIRSQFNKHLKLNPSHPNYATKPIDSYVHIHLGPKRNSPFNIHKFKQASFVITTYDVLVHDRLNTDSPAFNTVWKRIVLDEAHIIRNTKTQRNLAVSKLIRHPTCQHIALSGTAIINSITDIQTLSLFTQKEPFNLKSWWTTLVPSYPDCPKMNILRK